jgi:thiol-disulfide isomerase/thioredoxin
MRAMARFFVLLAWLIASPSFAAAGQRFDQATFDALLKSGKPTLVMVHADWCPTCRAQAPIVSELLKTPALSSITALRVDFDGQADVVKSFRVTTQSTLIVFKAGHEVGRSVGDTRKESIEALLKRAI